MCLVTTTSAMIVSVSTALHHSYRHQAAEPDHLTVMLHMQKSNHLRVARKA